MTKEEAIKEAKRIENESGFACSVLPDPEKPNQWIILFGVSQESADKNPELCY